MGKIHGPVMGTGKNRVAFALSSFGGFLGMGNKTVRHASGSLRALGHPENKLIFNVDKELQYPRFR